MRQMGDGSRQVLQYSARQGEDNKEVNINILGHAPPPPGAYKILEKRFTWNSEASLHLLTPGLGQTASLL